MTTVAVMMSTYNGERFLREQLDSILAQEDVCVSIYVRDDCSSDNTRKILREYADHCDRFYVDLAQQNLGVGNSFMQLIYDTPAKYDYFAFSDQDDIWEPRKLMEAVSVLREKNALLYGSNQECVDKDGNSLGLRYSRGTAVNTNPIGILERNMIAGCTMVFTKQFFSILQDEAHRPSTALLRNRIHDVWVAMVASVHDGLAYDERSFIKYRQHENNVVGAYTGGMKNRVRQIVKKMKDPNERNGRSKLAKEICIAFPHVAEQYALLSSCAESKSARSKLALLREEKELRRYSNESYFGFFAKVIFNLF